MKYSTVTKKEEILSYIVTTFEKVRDEYFETHSDYDRGRYDVMMELLRKIEIHESRRQ